MIGKSQCRGLKLGILRQGGNAAYSDARLFIRGRNVRAAALSGDNRNEPVPAGIAGRHKAKAATQSPARQYIRIYGIAAAIGNVPDQSICLRGPEAGKLYRPGKRARAINAGTAATRDPRLAQSDGLKRRPGHPTAKGITLRHAVEHQQRARGGIAAQATQCRTLARSIGRARIRPAELLESSDIAQRIFDTV